MSWAEATCLGFIKSDPLKECISDMTAARVKELFVDPCIQDSIMCDQGGDCECQCEQFENIVENCENLIGKQISWRSNEICRENLS